jgi:hypothetical protein
MPRQRGAERVQRREILVAGLHRALGLEPDLHVVDEHPHDAVVAGSSRAANAGRSTSSSTRKRRCP